MPINPFATVTLPLASWLASMVETDGVFCVRQGPFCQTVTLLLASSLSSTRSILPDGDATVGVKRHKYLGRIEIKSI